VRVVQFKSRFCDNPLRKCYYWELEGPVGVIFRGPPGARMYTDLDSREGYRAEVLEVLDPATRPEDIPECYKWERERGRSQFMFRHKDGKKIYYLVSTL